MSEDTEETTAPKPQLVKLFDLYSCADCPPAADAPGRWAGTSTITVTPAKIERCVPLRLRLTIDTAESFQLLEINCGVERLLACAPARAEAEDRGEPDVLLPVVMQCGMDFSVVVKNLTAVPKHFHAEVWGRRGVPIAGWRRCILIRKEDLHTIQARSDSLAAIELTSPVMDGLMFEVACETCGHRYQLGAGDRIPLWCGMCVEEQWHEAREEGAER